MKSKLALALSILLISLIGCGPSAVITSTQPEKKITIDGNQEDWNGKLKYFEDKKVAVGFLNDDDYLYYCVVTSDKQTAMKIMALGLTTWFQPSTDEQTIGVQFPKRMDQVKPRSLMGKNRDKNGKSDFQSTVNTMMQNQGEFSLVNDDDEILFSAPIGKSSGYTIKVGATEYQFVLEAKIPIGNNELAQIPINVFSGEKVNVEFKSGAIDMDELQTSRGMSGGGMSGGHGGGGGMRGGGRGQGNAGQNRVGLERFSLDVEVKLTK